MIYRFFITAILLCTFQSLFAQVDEYTDVVELKDGNRVVGKITENKPGEQVTIQSRGGSIFTFKVDHIKNIIEKNNYIDKQINTPASDVKSVAPPAAIPKDSARSDAPAKIIPAPKQEQKSDRTTYRQLEDYTYETQDTLNLRIDIEVGYSYRMAKLGENIPSEFKDYVDKLKSGWNIAANISYFFSAEYGICLDYSRFMTSNSMGGVYIYDPISMTTQGPGIMEDNIAISFFGIGLAGRKIFSDGDILLVGNFSLGVASYNNDAKLLDDSYLIEGSTFAYTGFLSLDFMVSSKFALGIGISYLGGTLKDAKVNGQSANLGEENLFRLDFNAGVKFYF